MESGVHLNQTLTNTKNLKIENIMNLLREGEKIKYSQQGNVVLFLGNSGSGKTTSVQFIAGNIDDLISQEVREDTGEFIIIDKNNKISYNSTISSKTIYPEMLVTTNSVFYDCPGFSDTRSPAYDISSTYFTKKIIDSSKTLKLVFVISYPSVRQGVDRHDFMLLVRHATTMIKNIDKFQDNIALLVTKVDNDYIKKKGEFLLVSDFQIINKIADFLKLARDELNTKVDLTENDKEFHKKAIKFIDILLTKQVDNYVKIGIFRRPDDSAPLSQIQVLQKEKAAIINLIDNNLDFVSHLESDFSYTISAESKNYVHDLVDELNKAIYDSFKNIGESVQHYYNRLENKISDLTELHDTFQTADNTFSEIKNTNHFLKPHDVVRTIYNIADKLDIPVANKYLLNVLNFEKYINFLDIVSGESANNALIWTEGFKEVTNYIGKTKTLYRFLIDLYNRLSEYDIQKDIKKYDTSSLKSQITLLKQQPMNQKYINDLTYLKKFLEKVINSNSHLEYNNIKDVPINDRALDFLNRVLDETLNLNLNISHPISNRLVIKGHFVKLSDVISLTSSNSIKFIDILAVNTIFIDASLDKSGAITQLSILAPKWEIIGSQQLLLNGKPGESHYPQKPSNGYDGEAGYPGGSAGYFFGLGQTFINGEYLKILLIGGVGGPGQNGGNGIDGRNGEDPPLEEDDERDPWDKGNFTYDAGYTLTFYKKFFFFSKEYEHESRYVVYGKNGTDGGNGCDGGVGGKGGNRGKSFIIELNDKDKSKILSEELDGLVGSSGYGGQPGTPGTNGKKIKVYYQRYWKEDDDSSYTVRHDIYYKEDYLSPRTTGVIGKIGTSYRNYQNPNEVHFVDLPQTINIYKNYIRENLDTNTENLALRHFFNRVENNEHVSSLYDTKSFYDEFINLEKQINIFQDTSEMLPFYQSLLNRIIKYAEHPKISENSLEYKKVLAYLNTAVVARIYNVDKKVDPTFVLDMKSYTAEITNNINKLQDTKNISLGLDFYSKDKDEINTKINRAKVFLNAEVNTDIKNIITIVDNELELLLNTTHREEENILILEDENVRNMATEEENEHQLQDIIISKVFLESLNVSNRFFDFLNILGQTVTKFQTENIVNKFLILNESKTENIEKVHSVQDLLNKMKQLINGPTSFKDHLNIEELKKFFDDKYFNLSEDNFVKKLQDIIKNKDNSVNDLLKEIENQKKQLGAIKESNPAKYEILNLIENILITDDISIDIFNKVKYSFVKIKRFVEIVKKNKKQINKIQLFKQNIFNTLHLTCQSISNLLQNKIKPFVDFKESNIQSNLKNIRVELRQISKEVKINENLYQSVEKMDKLIVLLINIYDSLENNFNQAKLIGNIKNIKSSKAVAIIINETKLTDIINKLEQVINNNLVLGQYQKILNAYSQQIFPFGFNLNELLKSDYTEKNYGSDIGKTIALIGSKIADNKSVSQFDSYIHNNIEFSSKHVQITPFFVWKYDSIKEKVIKLLAGDEIRVRADIIKGVDKYAVKFNKIGIRIKLENQTLQNELNATLQNFGISLTHHGDSNYKYGKNIYTIFSDKYTVYYTLETNSNDEPVDKNKIYDIIKNNHCMLSPYATWSIKFTNVNNSFDSLNKFRNETLQIELEGQGQYIDPDIEFNNDDQIKQYYKVDEFLSEVENNKEDIDKIVKDLNGRNETITRQRRAVIDESDSSIIDSIYSSIKSYLIPIKKFNILNIPTSEINEKILHSKLIDGPVISNQHQLSGNEKSNIVDNKVDFGLLDVQSNLLLFDLVVKKWVGKKNGQRVFRSNDRKNDEYSQRLAYRGYIPK